MIYMKLYIYNQSSQAARDQEGFIPSGGYYIPCLVMGAGSDELKCFLSSSDKPLYGLRPSDFGGPFRKLDQFRHHEQLIFFPLTFEARMVRLHSGRSSIHIQPNVKVSDAAIYDALHPDGWIDPSLVEDPLAIMKRGKNVAAPSGPFAKASDVSEILWKQRNLFKVVPLTEAHLLKGTKKEIEMSFVRALYYTIQPKKETLHGAKC